MNPNRLHTPKAAAPTVPTNRGSGAMRFDTVDVSPEQALAWLEKTLPNQRAVRERVVGRYAADMIRGDWEFTHQAIAFDCRGRLIDGQHRLWAVVSAQITVPMLVATSVPDGAFDHVDHVDLGAGRGVRDILRIEGEDISANDIAIVRFIEGSSALSSYDRMLSPFQIREIVHAHAEALKFLDDNMERRVKSITTGPCLAAIGCAFYHEADLAKLAACERTLVSGLGTGCSGDAILVKYRDWVLAKPRHSRTDRMEVFLRGQRTVLSYMKDDGLERLTTPPSPCYIVKPRARP